MKPFGLYLWLLAIGGFALAVIYFLLTREVTGTVLFASLGMMPLVFVLWARRHDATPGDDPAARPSDNAGQPVGAFPSTTLWPMVLVLGCVVTGGGLVYGLILVPLGLGLLGLAIIGLMKESSS